jgi:hypothetical protein
MELDRIRASGKAAKAAAKLSQLRQRNLLVLMLRHLSDHGLPRYDPFTCILWMNFDIFAMYE